MNQVFQLTQLSPSLIFLLNWIEKRKEDGIKKKNIYKITHTFSLSTFNNKGRVVI